MDGYELAALLRNKVTITNAMLAADKLVELEDKLKKKTRKKDESKPSSNEGEASVLEQREITYDQRLAFDIPRTES